MINYLKNLNRLKKYIYHNKLVFKKKNDSRNIILLEKFDYYPSIIPISHFIERLEKKFNASTTIYEVELTSSLRKKFRSIADRYFPYSFNKIYSSFGCNNKVSNKHNSNIDPQAKLILEKLLKIIKTKKDILEIKIDNLNIGDLIYDSYLRNNKKPTIEIQSKEFKNFLLNFLNLFFYWKNYFNNNAKKIKAVVVSHDVYHFALPIRFCCNLKIPCYSVGPGRIYLFSSDKIRKKTGYEEFPEIFKNLNEEIKKKGLVEAEKTIKKKFSGELTFDILVNKFKKKNKLPEIINNLKNKQNILIATHCFTDAVHAYGESVFEDYYEWLTFLGTKSEEQNYKWLLKPHPAQYKENLEFLKYFEKKFKNFILVPNDISHFDYLEKIFAVVTVYGSVGHEFPLFNIPVINASINNPHSAYNFNYHAKNKKQFENLINNLKNLKVNEIEVKNKIYEYYYLNYLRDFYFFDDQLKVLNEAGKEYSKPKIFEFWLKEYSKEKHEAINHILDKFIDEKVHRLYDNEK